MPEREFELYLSVLSRLLRLNPQQKDAIADELRDHLEERFEELVRSGVPRDDAIRQALDEFGDAAGLAVDFTAVSKKRIRRLIMRSTAAVTALIALIAFFLADLQPQQLGAPALPGPAVAVAQSDEGSESGNPGRGSEAIPKEREESDELVEPPLPPLERISGPPLLPRQLNEWTQMQFEDVPLVEALTFLSDLHDFPIVIDELAFNDNGIDTDLPVSMSITHPEELTEALQQEGISQKESLELRERYFHHLVPLHLGLTWLLKPHQLDWYVEDEVLHITTEDAGNEDQIVRSYPIRRLVKSGIAPSRIFDTVMLMTDGEWEDIDGSGGTLSVVGDVLTVRHSYQMHRQVEALLAALSQHSPWHYVEHPQRHVLQLELLEQTVDGIDFVDAPLRDVIEYMTLATGTPLRLDETALNEEGIAGDEPVTLRLPDRPLRTALKLVLDPLQLTVIVQDGVLTVTSYEVESNEAAMHTVIYDVREIEAAADPPGTNQTRLQAVVESIQNTTDYWEEIDGAGGVLDTPGGGRLVVRHTDTEHRQIRELLAAHRRLLKEDDQNVLKSPSSEEVETRFYRVPADSAEDLLTTIPELVARESWIVPQFPEDPRQIGVIRKVAVGERVTETQESGSGDQKAGQPKKQRIQRTVVKESVLIIRNTRAVHMEIDQLLRDLGLNVISVLKGKGNAGSGGLGGGGGLF